jgi:hypothetical protein
MGWGLNTGRAKDFFFPKLDMQLTKPSVQWVAGVSGPEHEVGPSH